jgi:peroxiredoxin
MFRLVARIPAGAALWLLLLAACSSREPVPPSPLPARTLPVSGGLEQPLDSAQAAPDFSRPDLAGGVFTLSEQRGKVVLVNFWATWCAPCVRETPALVGLYRELADEGFTIVGVSLDQEGFDAVRPFATRYDVPYPMILDDGSLAEAFGGMYGLPTTFVIDGEGRIVRRFLGEFPVEAMKAELRTMVEAS